MALTVALKKPGGGTYAFAFEGAPSSLVHTVVDQSATPFTTTTVTDAGLSMRVADITFDSSYATGGETLAASDFGLTSLVAIICCPAVKSDNTDAMAVTWNKSTGKLMLWRDAATNIALAQFTNTGDASAYTCRVLALGHA